MTPDQISRLLDLLGKIASKSQNYTITGAADWPILAAMGFILIALIGFMWRDLRATMRENIADSKKNIDNLWVEMRECKKECHNRLKSKI